MGSQPVSRATLFGQYGEDGAMELQPDGHGVGCLALDQMAQRQVAAAGVATQPMQGGSAVGFFEPQELDGVGGHVYECGLVLGGAVAQSGAAQMSHAFAGQLALAAGPGAPVAHGLTLRAARRMSSMSMRPEP